MTKPQVGKYWIGFDLGGTKMLATVFDDRFQKIGKDRRKTMGHEGVEAGLLRIASAIEAACDNANISVAELGGIGIGIPGPLDLDAGIIKETANLGWQNVAIKDYLEKKFGCSIVIANDVDVGVFGEYRFGAGKGAHCLLGVFPGTGIGGGCVYEGQILRGRTGSCLEIGHMQAVIDGPRCGCGHHGCLEAIAGRLVIASAAAAAAHRGDAPYLMKNVGTDLVNIRSRALAESIAAGDQEVEAVVRHAAYHIGRVIGNVVNLLAPDVVVLGGGLVEAIPQLIADTVREAVRETAMDSFKGTYCVEVAKLGDDASVMGAAAWAREVVQGQQ